MPAKNGQQYIERLKNDGADNILTATNQKKAVAKTDK